MRRQTPEELTSRESLKKRKGAVRPPVSSSSVAVWTVDEAVDPIDPSSFFFFFLFFLKAMYSFISKIACPLPILFVA
jgi:hypothetical protein